MCACAPALRPLLSRLLTKRSTSPDPFHSEEPLLPAKPIPSLKPRKLVQYPTGDEPVYIDLEGIAPDRRSHAIRVLMPPSHRQSTQLDPENPLGVWRPRSARSARRRSRRRSRRHMVTEMSIPGKVNILERLDEADDEGVTEAEDDDDDDRSFGNVGRPTNDDLPLPVAESDRTGASSPLGFERAMRAERRSGARVQDVGRRRETSRISSLWNMGGRESGGYYVGAAGVASEPVVASRSANEHLTWANTFDRGSVGERRWSPTNPVNASNMSVWAGTTYKE
jgi:hypothetical protein